MEVRAEEGSAITGATGMTLEEMIEALSQHNMQLEQARANFRSAKALGPQQRAPNNPQLGLVNNSIPKNPLNLGQSQAFDYTVTQSFQFPGKKRLAGEIADNQAEFANSQVEALYLQLVAQLKNNFYQELLLQRQLDINREGIQRLEQIKQVTKVRYANNAAAFVDFLNAQVAQSSAENDQFSLQRQADTVRQTLNTLIGRDPQIPLTVVGELPSQDLPKRSLLELEAIAIEHNPNLKGGEFQVKVSRKELDLAGLAYYPDFQVVVTGNSTRAPLGIGNVNSWGLEFDLIVPLWFFTKERYGLQQARASLEASRAGQAALGQQTRLAVDTAYNTLAQAVNQSQFIRARQLPETEAAFRLALTNYSNGGLGFVDLLTAQANLRTTQLALVQGYANAIQAFANLTSVIGMEVE